jgi:hypothetical protein
VHACTLSRLGPNCKTGHSVVGRMLSVSRGVRAASPLAISSGELHQLGHRHLLDSSRCSVPICFTRSLRRWQIGEPSVQVDLTEPRQGGGEPSPRGSSTHDGTELADHGSDRRRDWVRRSRAHAPRIPARLRKFTAGPPPTRSLRRGLAPTASMARARSFTAVARR